MKKVSCFIFIFVIYIWLCSCSTEKNKYEIVFDTKGGNSINSVVLEEYSILPSFVPVKEGFKFMGWYKDVNCTTGQEWNLENDRIVNNTTLYAKWEKQSFQVIFDSVGGSSIDGQTILYGDKVNQPSSPLKEHYTFLGWYEDSQYTKKWNFDEDIVTSSITLYAKWNMIHYNITLDWMDGTNKEKLSIVYGNKITNFKVPTKMGYQFSGWYQDRTYQNEWNLDTDIVSNDFTLYAKWIYDLSLEEKDNLSVDGYAQDHISDFKQYEGTEAYRVVTTPEELIDAIAAAKYHYKNVWDDTTKTYIQLPADGYTEETIAGTVHVIEIANDMNLGYYQLSESAKAKSEIVSDFCRNKNTMIQNFTMSDMFIQNGMTQLKVENTSNLLIYSKNGAKLTHCGFKLTSDDNVVFRNLEFDELWQWEDTANSSVSKVGDYDAFGWAYFKIAFCGYIWIDHCTFGKSYDGQIDYSNPVYDANAGTAFRAPYGANGSNGLHISWCKFNAGSDDPNGYIYQMMSKIEENYLSGGTDYLYYNQLRANGISFEDILYGIAIPQKKGFLCGDSGNNKEDYEYNLKLQISFANCYFKNLEDRIPKLRGGNAYIYNCIVDSLEYHEYRTKLKDLNVANIVSSVNSSWKCGLVSQGILCGNGGSIKAENCVFMGIETLLKNNDSNTADKIKGGYQLVNCKYQPSKDSVVLTSGFPNASSSTLSTNYFTWHTEGHLQPFEISPTALRKIDNVLMNNLYGVGVKNNQYLDFLMIVYE